MWPANNVYFILFQYLCPFLCVSIRVFNILVASKDREVYFPEIIDLWKWDNHPPMQELYDSFNYDFGKYIVLLDGAIDVLNKIKNHFI